MALIIEDGSIVTNADSYVERADYIAYAADFGITIEDDEDADIQLIQAAKFIDSKESQLIGQRVERDQALAYPRQANSDGGDITIEGWDWSKDEIPRQVLLAQMALALDLNGGEDLYNPTQTLPVVRQKVGVIERQFANPTNAYQTTTQSSSTALLSSLMKRAGLYSMPLVRA